MSAALTYSALAGLRVSDAVHLGLISCPPETSLHDVARMMTTYRVHAILVSTHGGAGLAGGRHWGVITDMDVLRASGQGDPHALQAGALASVPPLWAGPGDDLADAASLMVEHAVSHIVVVDPVSERPLGVLSTLDVARAIAGFPERHPYAPA